LTATEKTMTAKMKRLTRTFVWLGLGALLFSTLLQPAAAHAQSQDTASPALQVERREGGLHLQWQGSVQAASTGEAAQAPTPYGGYLLPLQTVMVELPAEQASASAISNVAIAEMSSSLYTGALTPAPTQTPPALDYVPTPTNTPYVEPHLPTSPIFVIGEGLQRGRHLAVMGFSPIYQDPNTGEIRSVDNFDAMISGASIVADASADQGSIMEATADPNDAALFTPLSSLASAPGPTNPLANTNALKVFVSDVGIQQISGADLAAAGLSSPKADKVRVFYQGVEVPLQILDGNHNNVLDAGDSLRFYAYAAGDTWNTQSVYWLATGSTNGLRMSQRAVAAAGANARNTAYEVGQYQHSSVYETTLAGADGDNWFQANLQATTASASFAITLPHHLTLNNALPTLLTLNITPYSIGAYSNNADVAHRLQLSTSGLSVMDSWESKLTGAVPFENLVHSLTLGKAADTWTITLLKEATGRAVMVDAIDYLLPVKLDFKDKGATFQSVDGTWRYQLTNTPTNTAGGRALYDITDPTQPQQLTIPGGAAFEFQDGPSIHRYVMTGAGTFFTPSVEAHAPVNLGGAGAAHTIYIAPKEFHATLQPLVDLRKSQGYKVSVVDVQAIYDAWSYGMVDAKAIRSFLRFAAGHWSPAPIAAILVGDTTWDPHNFWGYNNPQIIPPYIANVDPWIKYVPCDSCYGQLDGDDPAKDYLVDLWIGRFPVIDTVELNTVVNKIVNYETAKDTEALWRSTSLQLADDDVRPDNTVDTAGPFVGSSEHIVSLMPVAVRQLRNYFMAATNFSGVPSELMSLINAVRPWYTSDPTAAMQRSIDLMNDGVGIVTYTGHANHWQWARIVADGQENKWLFGLWEVRQLNNINSPFISMSMSCYTSQFHKPEVNHFTLDEHLFIYGNGGAISTWGPTGFSVVPAHDTLQTGFHKLLWKSPALKAKLGALTEAGYKEIFASGVNFDVNKTFAFMGDPLTSARITPVDTMYIPKLNR
jgi:hypothetical protein